MLVIRFARTGRKNKAQFRIVVQEHSVAPKGKHIEILGNWDPHQKQGIFKNERIEYWLSQGAQASDSVHNLLVAQGVIKDRKRFIKMSKKKSSEENTDEEKSGKEKKKSPEKKTDDKKEDNNKEVDEKDNKDEGKK